MSARVALLAVSVLAGLVAVQAAGGIKGQDSQQRLSGLKGPALRPPPQAYLPPPPPPPPPAQPLPLPLPQRPIPQAIKGPGQVAPVFSAVRVQPIAQPIAQPIIQQQQIIQQQEQEPEPAQQQPQQQIVQQVVQQQQEEIDPNAAAQDNAPAVVAPARVAPAAAAAAASEEEANPRPEPYAFQYAFDAGDSASSGSSQREETQDANGRVTGFYTLRGDDGRDRRVDYVADASGFRATISTNEMGTAPKDSADVDWNAQAPSEAQLRAADSATQQARQRALANPQGQASSWSSSSSSSLTPQKVSSPRQNVAAASSLAASKTNKNNNNNNDLSQQTQISQQLQEPFEQIRQVELNGRARKSRHAPFYLFTI